MCRWWTEPVICMIVPTGIIQTYQSWSWSINVIYWEGLRFIKSKHVLLSFLTIYILKFMTWNGIFLNFDRNFQTNSWNVTIFGVLCNQYLNDYVVLWFIKSKDTLLSFFNLLHPQIYDLNRDFSKFWPKFSKKFMKCHYFWGSMQPIFKRLCRSLIH